MYKLQNINVSFYPHYVQTKSITVPVYGDVIRFSLLKLNLDKLYPFFTPNYITLFWIFLLHSYIIILFSWWFKHFVVNYKLILKFKKSSEAFNVFLSGYFVLFF